MTTVGFLTTIGVNVGDEFIRNGLRAVLDNIGIPYSPLYVNKHNPKSLWLGCEDEDHSVRDKFLECDLFLQAGAPVYWNLSLGANSLNSEWHQWMWLERILAKTNASRPIFANLGAGSCQPWDGTAAEYLSNSDCREFARQAHARAQLTTVRDPVAKSILDTLDCAVEGLPCPALLAAARFAPVQTRAGIIGVNWMPLGSHYDLEGGFPQERWMAQIREMLAGLRKLGRLWFIAHDAAEVAFQEQFLEVGERVFFQAAWRDYLDAYGACSVVVANRVHGAVTAAGFGVPSVIIGNDTRAQIGDYIGLPRFRSGEVEPGAVVGCVASLLDRRSDENTRLLDLRAKTMERYSRLLQPLVERAAWVAGHRADSSG